MELEGIEVGILSIVPPLIAITLALITKEVIFALLLGVGSGMFIYSIASGMGVIATFQLTTDLMIDKVSSNGDMMIFLALLGALVVVVTRAGGSRAYGLWAAQRLRGEKGTGIATTILAIILFIDDYFSCLAVGTVMRPISDMHKMSREKLAYFVDSTAAPICIIAPVSSWAAAVVTIIANNSSMNGMQAFIMSIPMNLYAILTLFMIFWLAFRPQDDYGPMAKAQRRAKMGQIESESWTSESSDELANVKVSEKGVVLDLVIPVLVLIVLSIIAMLSYGGFWNNEAIATLPMGERIFEAFGETVPGPALALASFISLIVAFVMYVPRKIIDYKEFFSSMADGVKSMVPALMVLTLAWSIGGVCVDFLKTDQFVADMVSRSGFPPLLIPAIMFVVACFLAFATGTAWGTFGILIPITLTITEAVAPELKLTITALSAVLAGSVFGNHCSPIGDTSILSSTGAQCNIIDHIATQMPYGITAASVSVVGYVIAGLTSNMGYAKSVSITLPLTLALLVVVLLIVPKALNKRTKA